MVVFEERVKRAIEGLKEGFQRNQGSIDLVKVEQYIVYVKFKGQCESCELSSTILREGVERYLKHLVPEVEEVRTI